MKNLIIFLLLGLSTRTFGQELEIDPAIDQTRIDLQGWWADLRAHYQEITTTPEALPERIPVVPFLKAADCLIRKEVSFDIYALPGGVSNYSYPAYRKLTRSFFENFTTPCRGTQDSDLNSQIAEAKTALYYRKMYKLNPVNYPYYSTAVLNHGMNVNDPKDVVAVNRFFLYAIRMSGAFELLANKMGGSLKPADEELNKVFSPYRRRPYGGRWEALVAIDRAGGKINGVLPSTFINEFASNSYRPQDGMFFRVYAERRLDELAPQARINPSRLFFELVNRVDGQFKFFKDWPELTGGWKIQYVVKNASGGTAATGTIPFTVEPADPFYAIRDIQFPVDAATISDTTRNAGAYQIHACIVKTGAGCDPDPKLSDTTYTLLYPGSWIAVPRKIFVIANGPGYYDLSDTQLSLVGDGGEIERYPGYVVVSGLDEAALTDGKVQRTFQSDWGEAVEYLFATRDQPSLYTATNSATFEAGPAVPGSILTLWTWGATHTDPEVSQSFPLPTVACGGRTKVEFTDEDGKTLLAPFFYCSQTQLNILTPKDLKGPRAKTKVILGEVSSNEIELEVKDAYPRIFLMNAETKTGAVIFASGPNAGKVVTSALPARPGDDLAVFATGLGETYPPLPSDGLPAATTELYRTVKPVTVQASNGNWEVGFAGLAPGFAGLYQVNIKVPQIPTGTVVRLALVVDGKVSNEVLIPVQ